MNLNRCLHCGGEADFVTTDGPSVHIACRSCKIRTPTVGASLDYAAKNRTAAVWNAAAPAEEWPAWVQPTGAQDAYPLNARVSHGGKRWVSTTDHNVWEPGVYGWTEQVAP